MPCWSRSRIRPSASYHQWLTPATYAAQFGMSAADLESAQAWLQAQGFTIVSVAQSRNAIQFSGTVAQVNAAFHTEMHQYQINGVTRLANSTVLTLPAALAGAVAGIRNVAQFRPHPMHTAVHKAAASPEFTSSLSGDHYLAPSDITTIYDIKALYNAGYTGTGESLAITGESAIATTDLDAFRTASGLAIKEPTQILVPGTGKSTVSSEDEVESDIDLEWSGAIAENATIYFVYAGASGSVFDAMQYAIDNDTAPIISISYGECEADAGSDPKTLEPLFKQANAQGQTVLASSGDEGATGCDYSTNASQVITSAQYGLAVSYPASSAYVTAMGGSQLNEGSGSYWNTTNDSGGGSALSYIPETAWNDTTASIAAGGGLSGTGGGKSILFGKPSWQVATNVPNDSFRDVPDISLDAAVYHDSLLYCNAGSCTNGFRDAGNYLTAGGGTSFDAPIFAGVLALIHQKTSSTGSGNINPTLYSLYGTAASAFHDITTGNNEEPCTSGSTDCPTGTTEIGYSAGPGYDLVTGLGSIDAYNLATVFPTSTVTTGSLISTTTTLASSPTSPTTGTTVTFTATVSAASGTVTPAGTVQFAVNGTNVGSAVTLSSGAASYATSFATTGTDTITATYSGDATYATSTSSLAVTVVSSSSSSGTFTLAATNVSVAAGATGTSTLTVTPVSGYKGTVDLTYSTPSTFTGCLAASNAAPTVSTATTVTITAYTSSTNCVSTATRHILAKSASTAAANTGSDGPLRRSREYPVEAALVLAGLGLLGRKRKAWPLTVVLVLGGLGTLTVLSGCGSKSTSTTSTNTSTATAAAGTYTITLIGTDSSNSSLTASTTFSLVVQ